MYECVYIVSCHFYHRKVCEFLDNEIKVAFTFQERVAT